MKQKKKIISLMGNDSIFPNQQILLSIDPFLYKTDTSIYYI